MRMQNHIRPNGYQETIREGISAVRSFRPGVSYGAGDNTPVIIKYPFWAMTAKNPKAVYACLNYSEAFCPKQIEARSICIDGDAGAILDRLN